MFDKFDYFNRGYIFGVKTDKYKPYINYDWSTTTTSGLRYLKDVGSTPTYNASMYFGRGAYLNGVDQSITVPINTTIQTSLKRVNGVVNINETSQTLTNYVISGLGVHKDYYLFTRLLTTAEKDSYTNTPELFYAMAQADSTCVLNMPMCETSSTVRNYKNGADYPITNYTSSVRDNAKNLQYGLQTCKFVRDSLGVIQSASDYLVLDKTADGYGYINNLSIPSNLTMEIVFDQSNSNYANYNKLLDWETNFKIERLGTSNTIYGVVGTTNIGSLSVSSADTAFIVYVLNFTTSTVLRYLNSVFIGENPMPASTLFSAKKLYLGNNSSLNRGIGGVIKLFKVHNKALTKEEITKNYNEYVAKGLLS